MLQSTSIDNFNNNTQYDNQWSPVHCCCINGNKQILLMLVANGLDYAAQNRWKQSPLHICAIKNHYECAQILIDKYNLEQLSLTDEFNKSAEKVALEHSHVGIVKLIRRRRSQLRPAQKTQNRQSQDFRYNQGYNQRYHQNNDYQDDNRYHHHTNRRYQRKYRPQQQQQNNGQYNDHQDQHQYRRHQHHRDNNSYNQRYHERYNQNQRRNELNRNRVRGRGRGRGNRNQNGRGRYSKPTYYYRPKAK